MTKSEYLKLAEQKWEALESLKTKENLYDYEKAFDKIWVDLGKSVLESSLGKKPKST